MIVTLDEQELTFCIVALEYLLDYHDDPDAPKSLNVLNLINKLKFCKKEYAHDYPLPHWSRTMILRHPHIVAQCESIEDFLDKAIHMYPNEVKKLKRKGYRSKVNAKQ